MRGKCTNHCGGPVIANYTYSATGEIDGVEFVCWNTLKKTPLTADTPLYTPHEIFLTCGGGDWLDGILGEQSCSEWVSSGKTQAEESAELADWLAERIGEGFYRTVADCEVAIRKEGSYHAYLSVREFTPREAVAEIHRRADAGE